MNQSTNYKCRDVSFKIKKSIISQSTKTTLKPKIKRKIHAKCNECNKRKSHLDIIVTK
jgi:hypothetical protein